jgi:hypothetical protein
MSNVTSCISRVVCHYGTESSDADGDGSGAVHAATLPFQFPVIAPSHRAPCSGCPHNTAGALAGWWPPCPREKGLWCLEMLKTRSIHGFHQKWQCEHVARASKAQMDAGDAQKCASGIEDTLNLQPLCRTSKNDRNQINRNLAVVVAENPVPFRSPAGCT